MNYWLLKTEPDTFSWSDLVRDKKASWDGVRNFQARKNIKEMKKGDIALIYHTGGEKAVVGLSKVLGDSYPEPKDADWLAIDIAPDKALKRPVSLSEIKADKRLANMVLVRAARLSVQPVTAEEFDMIMELSAK